MATELQALEVSIEQVKKELRNSRRRYTLFYLKSNGGEAKLDRVVDRITAWENNGEIPEEETAHRKSVYSSLYQRHLPKLVELGLISYDREDRILSLTEAGKQVSVKVPTTDHDCRSFSELFLVLGTLSGAILLLGLLNVLTYPAVFSSLFVILSFFFILVFLQFYDYRSWKAAFEEKGPDYVVELER